MTDQQSTQGIRRGDTTTPGASTGATSTTGTTGTTGSSSGTAPGRVSGHSDASATPGAGVNRSASMDMDHASHPTSASAPALSTSSASPPSSSQGSQAATHATTAPVTNPPRATGRRRSDRIISASAVMQEVVDQASGIARSDEPVILAGASGSGRKHVARAIHQWSARAGGPLVELQVAGTSEAVQQRELFGDESAGQPGAIARAQNGTLLIESADQLSPALIARLSADRQARLLATVSDDTDPTKSALSAFGNTHRIRLAALASRVEDILPLAAHFLAEFAAEASLEPVGFSADARRWLVEEQWSGNVRELRERIRQAIRLAGNGAISAEALMLSTEGDEVPSFKDAKRSFETRYVEGLLRRCSGNISRAARMAKKDRKDFYDVIRRTGVNPSEFRG